MKINKLSLEKNIYNNEFILNFELIHYGNTEQYIVIFELDKSNITIYEMQLIYLKIFNLSNLDRYSTLQKKYLREHYGFTLKSLMVQNFLRELKIKKIDTIEMVFSPQYKTLYSSSNNNN